MSDLEMTDLAGQRRFYAEEIQAIAGLKTAALVEALATVPRERFLPPGPWTFRSEADFVAGAPRQTADADPRHVCHNVTVAIDAARNLYNGNPSFVGMAIDALGLAPGARALHVGAGMGYYSALIGSCVGPSGRVVALEADEALAVRAKANLASMPWVEARHGDGMARDGMAPFGESFDAILVNAGVTHPPDGWLDALAPGGRMILPLTSSVASTGQTMGVMSPMANIGKGLLLLLTRADDSAHDRPDTLADLPVRVVTFVAIFNAVGARDEALNAELWKALLKNPFPPLKRLRRDPHEREDTCWLHGSSFCLSTA